MIMRTGRLSSMSGIAKRISRTFAVLSAMVLAWACLPAPAAVLTNTFTLGPQDSGTTITNSTDGLLPWIAKGTLPPGSMLRSVSVNARLDAASSDSWASDISAFFDPTPENPGTAALLQVGGYGPIGAVALALNYGNGNGWANGHEGPGTTVTDTKTDAAWNSIIGSVDLSTNQLSVGNGYAGWATWSGTITVTYDAAALPSIVTFGLPGNPAVIIGTNIVWTVPFGTAVTNLAPVYTLSSGTCAPASGSTNNFTGPVKYTVTAGAITNVYSVTVNVTPASTAKDMLTFGLPGHLADIDGTNITWRLPVGTAVTNLAPTYTVSPFASGAPGTGSTHNFTNPVTYTVTAQNGSTNVYTVTVMLVAPSGIIHVNIDTVIQPGLVGPAGGLGQRWNTFDETGGSFLLDSGGLMTTVGFTSTASSQDSWGSPTLTMLTMGAYNSSATDPYDLVITNLPTGKNYDLYIASYYPDEQGSSGTFTTSNTTITVGAQTNDNHVVDGTGGNSTTWVRGDNYVLFQSVEPDANNTITITLTGSTHNYDRRAMMNGFQLVAVVPATPPATPTGLTATPGDGHVSLTWTAQTNTTGFIVKRSLTSGAEAKIGTAAMTNYPDNAVTNGVVYYYKVSATNAVFESTNSVEVSARPLPAVAPKPVLLTGSGTNQGFRLDPATGAKLKFGSMGSIKYRIVYKDDLLTNVWTSLGDWQISPSNGDMELTDTNAMTRTQRFYRIEAHLP